MLRAHHNIHHNCFLVSKKSGEWRLCIDYRRLNLWTIRDSFNLPEVHEIIGKISKGKYFSVLDLRQAYYHIPIKEEDRHKTAFMTHEGLYAYNRMTFGFMNAPAICQRVLRRVLQGLENVENYLDDIIIATETEAEHLETLTKVFQRLLDYNIKLNIAKCELFLSTIPFLGHLVSHMKIEPDPEYIQKCINLPRPENIKTLEKFLGKVNWIAKFIPNLNTLTAPLHSLKKGFKYEPSKTGGKKVRKIEMPWIWETEQEQAFKTIIKAVKNTSYLATPTFDKPFTVHCDASSLGIGAVLLQANEQNKLVPCEFISRILTETQRRWPVIEQELFAIIHSVLTWRHYLLNEKFFLHTDHKPLLRLFDVIKSDNPVTKRLSIWTILLSEFTFDVIHLPGINNTCADFLSREIKFEINPTVEYKPNNHTITTIETRRQKQKNRWYLCS